MEKPVSQVSEINLEAQNIGKRFGREWIFRRFSGVFDVNNPTAIVGNNGSGKSTFIKSLIGYMPLSEGKVSFLNNQKKISTEHWHQYFAWTAPYTELVEEFSLVEQLRFHQTFKPLSFSVEEIIDKLSFPNVRKKSIRFFSSGMKQKLKLALSLYAEAPILILDEPTSNLDQNNIDWYLNEIHQLTNKKVIIIASNQQTEYDFCTQIINIQGLKL